MTGMTDSKVAQREYRRSQRHDARKQKIVLAASGIVDARGPDQLTIRSVAAEAGYTPAALYPYFENRQGLIEDVFLHRLALLLKDKGALDGAALKALFDRDPALLGLGVLAFRDGAMTRPGADKLFTGKLLALLKQLAQTQDNQDPRHIMGLFCMILGLSVLDGTGRLEALEMEPQAILDYWS